MKLASYQYLELAGLVIVLLATTFQLTLLSAVTDISDNGRLYIIEEKINLLWFELRDSSLDDSLPDTRAQFFNSLTGGEGRATDQKNVFSKWYTIIMLFGSALLVVGRYLEMKANPKSVKISH